MLQEAQLLASAWLLRHYETIAINCDDCGNYKNVTSSSYLEASDFTRQFRYLKCMMRETKTERKKKIRKTLNAFVSLVIFLLWGWMLLLPLFYNSILSDF